jgi:glycerol-3-phosphate dehydrogenase
MSNETSVDLLIIGGGVNGAGIARDAAGRGLKVMLCEQGDLASATSSASSKLIHGGLRYLEYYQFGFVREALKEREILLGIAPHIVWPARFILVHDKSLRPAWMIGAGLFLYDWLALRKRLSRSQRLDLRRAKDGAPLKEHLTVGFAYSDCRVDDARLVVLNAVDARERGASIRTRTRCISAKREAGLWRAALLDLRGATIRTVTARALVNAAGPWAGGVLSEITGRGSGSSLRLVKGSHIIVPRLYEGEHSYVLQNEDRRIIFVMPYEDRFSLIGTTEVPFAGNPATAKISAAEIAYLTAAVSRYFRKPLNPGDVIESFSGVRPLSDSTAVNASAASRDYVLDLDAPQGCAPLLSVLGGKITTYRRLAEDAMEKLAPHLNLSRARGWTARVPLPGGGIEGGDPERLARGLRSKYPWLAAVTAARLAHAYGTRAELILGNAQSARDLGQSLGAGLYQAEVDYLIDQEFALTAEDILWRRSKRGLLLSPAQRAGLSAYVEERVSRRGRAAR